MAHPASTREAVRRAYVTDRAPLAEAARRGAVSVATARAWKRTARDAGDDWDRAREARRLAEGGLGSVTERVLSDFSVLFTSTMDSLRTAGGEPVEVARAIAMLADAYAKTVKAAGGVDPRLARLSIALETLERLGHYLREHRPEAVPVLLGVLEPFGATLSAEWG